MICFRSLFLCAFLLAYVCNCSEPLPKHVGKLEAKLCSGCQEQTQCSCSTDPSLVLAVNSLTNVVKALQIQLQNLTDKVATLENTVKNKYGDAVTTAPPTTQPPPTTARPTTQPPPPTCQGHVDGTMLADPSDCHKYYHCAHGIAFHKTCPAKLAFVPSILVCADPACSRVCRGVMQRNKLGDTKKKSSLRIFQFPTLILTCHVLFTILSW